MPLVLALQHLAHYICEQTDASVPWDALRSLGPAFAANPTALARIDPPVDVRSTWMRDLRATRASNVLLQAELARILGELDAAGVDALVYKGAAALDRLYADPGLRPMDDADILVQPVDRERAAVVLRRLGFAVVPIDVGRLGPIGPSLHAAQTFRRTMGTLSVEIDLHWHPIADARLRAAFPGAGDNSMWARAELGEPRPGSYRRLATIDAAILTAVLQIFGHPWSHPLGYLDLHLLVADFGTAEWTELVGRARAWGLAGPMSWGLRFAGALFGTNPTASHALAPHGLGRRLGERLVGGDWLGMLPARRQMPARDLFVLLLAGPRGSLRMARASLVDREPDGMRRLSTLDPRSSARTALWLAQAAIQTLGARPAHRYRFDGRPGRRLARRCVRPALGGDRVAPTRGHPRVLARRLGESVGAPEGHEGGHSPIFGVPGRES